MDLSELEPLFLSLRLGLAATLILLFLAFPLAWVFARSGRAWVPWVESLCSLGSVLPPTVLGFYLLLAFSPSSPFGAWLDASLGIRLAFNFNGLVLASCLAGLPFMLSALRNGIADIPESLIEAARSLGKGFWARLFLVVIPLLRRALLSGSILVFTHTLGEFGVVMMIGGSIPGMTKVVSIAIWEQAEGQDMAGAHRYALILLLISYAAVFAVNRLQGSGGRKPAGRP